MNSDEAKIITENLTELQNEELNDFPVQDTFGSEDMRIEGVIQNDANENN